MLISLFMREIRVIRGQNRGKTGCSDFSLIVRHINRRPLYNCGRAGGDYGGMES